ncbi:amino acid ABC transporter ATP-binding protein [Agrobacterium tumefaciens]|uniref:Amino acid ABC transporter ATP-binding protein n=1 Tax=Agrobacterium tumefaciens TaxID=358 RepID=A0AA44F5X0_AGRTU|nr:amino acid ABC transporter ATP-binding protein [Agrobacterium tumefaciens]NSL21230.1 amino acid ABC transporter ATP-binding protein [Agrobacterium tumefaciens]NTB83802.1 amino acid ABC transporter ATP-binding protein [Agrobacterium tumefaciens]NTC20729.1 amino acid ABC transporter ATP-binding protein [Agrobacterium tumefaciens]NTC29273.1 amino acid ABC transporter ATP-binding protein [Agrobacterium tumefaciens]NTC57769.1 amino acid ABC transporter ATP-binding protein [Agrobacterium tumefaci
MEKIQDASNDGNIIDIKNLEKYYGNYHALRDVSLSVKRGEVIAIIGSSGSGKSTLIRCINLLESYTSGSIEVDGIKVEQGKNLARVRAEVGMVFQQFNLFPHMTALHNVANAPVRVRGLSWADANERAKQLLTRVGLADHTNKYPSQLSGGQQQRVAIARALAMEPYVLLFDEPTSALDPEMVGEVLDVIQSLAKTGVTMLVVTHEMSFARRISDRVIFMEKGQIIEQNKPDLFFDSPQTERAKDFLSSIVRE